MTRDLKNETRQYTRKALGRGLASLLPEVDIENIPVENVLYSKPLYNSSYFMCQIDKLVPSIQQPRQQFNEQDINDLSESIKENGVIQPLIVRKRGDNYEIIAGERRWRASKRAGLKEVPVIFKEMSDKVTLQTALVENIQRSDLNAMEEARAYKQLVDEYNMTQDDISKKVGKDRSTITNCLRLLKLPEFVQREIENNKVSLGHAKVICSLNNDGEMRKVTEQILNKDLSVRETELLVNRIKTPKNTKTLNQLSGKKGEGLFTSIEDNLREKFKTKVHVKGRYEKGSFVIDYFNKDDFERILGILFG